MARFTCPYLYLGSAWILLLGLKISHWATSYSKRKITKTPQTSEAATCVSPSEHAYRYLFARLCNSNIMVLRSTVITFILPEHLAFY